MPTSNDNLHTANSDSIEFDLSRFAKPPNAGLQLRRAVSIRVEGTRLLESQAIAAVSCKALFGGALR